MKHLPLVALVALSGCSATQTAQVQTALASDPGQLFCDIQLAGGGSMVAGVVDAEASALAPGLAPVAVLATDAGKQFVDDACTKAAKSITGATSGVAVSPPLNPAAAPQVAIVKPAA